MESQFFLLGSWILLKVFQLYTRTAKLLLIWHSIAKNTVGSPTVLLLLSCHKKCGTCDNYPILSISCVKTVLTRSLANQPTSVNLILFSLKYDCEIADQYV